MDTRISMISSLPLGARSPVGSDVHIITVPCDQGTSRALPNSRDSQTVFRRVFIVSGSYGIKSLSDKEIGEIFPGRGTSIRKCDNFKERYF